jgi:hypothetical protein
VLAQDGNQRLGERRVTILGPLAIPYRHLLHLQVHILHPQAPTELRVDC